MLIAALDTSTDAGAFAVCSEDASTRVKLEKLPVGRFSADLFPNIMSALADANIELTDIAEWHVGMGPGSFTGIRVGAAFARGVCAGTGARFLGIPTSLGLVRQAQLADCAKVIALHDGRRNEVIISPYKRAGEDWEKVEDARAIPVADLPSLPADRFVMVANERLQALFPPAATERTIVLPGVDACCLMDANPLLSADLEPIYVRPAVFVPPAP